MDNQNAIYDARQLGQGLVKIIPILLGVLPPAQWPPRRSGRLHQGPQRHYRRTDHGAGHRHLHLRGRRIAIGRVSLSGLAVPPSWALP